MPPLEAIAFDLDDTLFPERQYALSGFAAVADWAEQALGLPSEQSYQELSGYFEAGVRGDTFNHYLQAHGQPAEPWLGEMIQVYRDHTPRLTPFPDVLPALGELAGEYRLGLITQGHAPGQQRKLQALGLSDRFEQVVIMGEEQRQLWKPNAYPFRRWLEAMGLRGEQTAYIGDNPAKDFAGSRSLGMWTVRVRRPDGQHAGEEPASPAFAPDLELSDLAQLPQAVQERAG